MSILSAPSGAQFLRADVAADGGTLAVAIPGRVLCSKDRGASWSGYDTTSTSTAAVVPSRAVTAIAVDPSRAGRVLVSVFPAPGPVPAQKPFILYESVDGCRSFTVILGVTQILRSLVFLPAAMVASADGGAVGPPDVMIRSDDGGKTWTPSGEGLDFSSPGGRGSRPAGPGWLQVMLLGLGHGPLVAVRGDVIHVGAADGRTWRRLSLPSFDPPPNIPPPNVVTPYNFISAIAATAGVPDSVFVLFAPDLSNRLPPLTAYSGVFQVGIH